MRATLFLSAVALCVLATAVLFVELPVSRNAPPERQTTGGLASALRPRRDGGPGRGSASTHPARAQDPHSALPPGDNPYFTEFARAVSNRDPQALLDALTAWHILLLSSPTREVPELLRLTRSTHSSEVRALLILLTGMTERVEVHEFLVEQFLSRDAADCTRMACLLAFFVLPTEEALTADYSRRYFEQLLVFVSGRGFSPWLDPRPPLEWSPPPFGVGGFIRSYTYDLLWSVGRPIRDPRFIEALERFGVSHRDPELTLSIISSYLDLSLPNSKAVVLNVCASDRAVCEGLVRCFVLSPSPDRTALLEMLPVPPARPQEPDSPH